MKLKVIYLYIIIFIVFPFLSCKNKVQEKNKNRKITNKSIRIRENNQLCFDNTREKAFNNDELNQWDIVESSCITKITFGHFDTIPKAFEKFSNVETINLGYDWQDIYVPDIFPKLKKIELDMAILHIEQNARFKNTLEEISGNKSTIKSINSFTELPNLNKIALSFSEFEPFPTDIDKLKKLKKFHLGAYTGKLDITNLSLSSIKSLKNVTLHTWYINTIYGFPNDIMKIDKSVQMEIEHNNLTKKQREILKKFTKPQNN